MATVQDFLDLFCLILLFLVCQMTLWVLPLAEDFRWSSEVGHFLDVLKDILSQMYPGKCPQEVDYMDSAYWELGQLWSSPPSTVYMGSDFWVLNVAEGSSSNNCYHGYGFSILMWRYLEVLVFDLWIPFSICLGYSI